MPLPLERAIPTVAVCNISETFYDFLARAADDTTRARLIRERQYKGDRALLWLGGAALVFTSLPIPHADWLGARLGLAVGACLAPATPSPWLSLDILREPSLTQRIVECAGQRRTVRLIPYATTREFLLLADTLRREHGLTVLLPESPASASLWVRDYVDTKGGFRALAARWLHDAHDLLPEGVACSSAHMAADVAHWFGQRGRACIIKADDGENGIGNRIVAPGTTTPAALAQELADDSFLAARGMVVEEFVHSSAGLSPSVELFVPPMDAGAPHITYLSDQVFTAEGGFGGVLMAQELYRASWYPRLADAGLQIGRGLQQMGYVGHFDMDAVVDDGGRVQLLEVNARRTGGTHVHEFARFAFGPSYLEDVALLSNDAIVSGGVTDAASLLAMLDGLLYPVDGQRLGIVPSITSSLSAGKFGAIFVAPTVDAVLSLQQTVLERVQASNGQAVPVA